MGVKGEIEKIEPLWKAQNATVFWHLVKLKDRPEEFALHMNWFASFGKLEPNDKVEYVISKAKLDHTGTQGINKKGYLLFNSLRKVEEKKTLEEEVLKLVEEKT